eukprot:10729539-Ditylum_brightwellii.AAC.1
MRVYLAVHIISSTMCCLIDWHANDCGGMEEYAPLRAILISLDWLIDICNATHMSHGKLKGCKVMGSPDHHHLQELSDTLKLFSEWKEETGDDNNKFIPQSAYEDLAWL